MLPFCPWPKPWLTKGNSPATSQSSSKHRPPRRHSPRLRGTDRRRGRRAEVHRIELLAHAHWERASLRELRGAIENRRRQLGAL